MLSAGSCLDVCMVARSFAVVLHKCHIFPALPVWSCGLSGAWPAGPLPPLFWKLHQKHAVISKARTRCYTMKR